MKKPLILLLFALCAGISANAQVAKMASVYTNLKNDCQAESKVETGEVAFICRAVGAYRVRIVPAGAWAEKIEIIDPEGETVAALGTHVYGYSTAPKRLLEWRMANGKHFAVIFRVNKYDAGKGIEDGDNPYLEKYKTGESLLVKGLPDHAQIDFEINARQSNANRKAQNLADENFQ